MRHQNLGLLPHLLPLDLQRDATPWDFHGKPPNFVFSHHLLILKFEIHLLEASTPDKLPPSKSTEIRLPAP